MKFVVPEISRIESVVSSQDDGVSFAQGSLKIDCISPGVRDRAFDVFRDGLSDHYGHPRGLTDLRVALADSIQSRYGVVLSMSRILVGHGSTGALMSLLLSVLQPGDEVVIPEPCYPVHRSVVRAARGSVRSVVAYVCRGGRWGFDLDAVRGVVSEKTKVVIVANPSNPVGYIFSDSELKALVDLAERYGFYLVVDEAYENFVFEGSYRSVLYDLSKRVVCLRTFSKGYGMSGWRVGYAVGQDDLIGDSIGVNSAVFSSANLIGQHAALRFLQHPEILEKSRMMVAKSREVMIEGLLKLGFEFVPPAGAFSIFCEVSGQDDTTSWVHDMLHAVRLAVVPGSAFSDACKSYIRLCYARPVPVIVEGLRRLKRFLEG